jgi:Co/Zn/Cd efflux system component
MFIDVFTYFTNMYAESVISSGDHVSDRMFLILHAGIPCFSLCALISITIWVCFKSIAIIRNPPDRTNSVDTTVMFAFASVNLLIDVVTVLMFLMNAQTALYKVPDEQSIEQEHASDVLPRIESGDVSAPAASTSVIKCNLNMLSAFSHVSADTLRTLAIFIGAGVATTGVNSAVADAWAAIICSCTILLALIPIFREIANAVREHKWTEQNVQAAHADSLLQDVPTVKGDVATC